MQIRGRIGEPLVNALADPEDCPYVGLDSFETAHRNYFFGRSQDSQIIADHVCARPVTILYGPSGVGKSSILNVGLPAALALKRAWMIALLRDWGDPDSLERLAIEAVLGALPSPPHRAVHRLALAPLIAWATRTTGRGLVLVFDQFEEYFLYRDRNRMRDLEVAMGDLVVRGDLPLHLLVALRDDSLYRLDELRAFVPGILDTTIKLGHLDGVGVEEAIRGPVARYNEDYRKGGRLIMVEDELVSTLKRQLKETGLDKAQVTNIDDQPVELSYLQLALTKLWTAEGGPKATELRESTLTHELGGVRRITRDHVETVMGRLNPEEQALCAKLFDRLVTGIGSKIAYPTEGLAAPDVAGPEVSQEQVEAVLRKLTPKESRILKPVTTGGLPGFEIFHDILGLPVLEWRRRFRAEERRRDVFSPFPWLEVGERVGADEPLPSAPTFALLLQGGAALCAYHIGAYQALAEHGLHPDWVAGISMGAINAAIIAGNRPEDRVERLTQLWEAISWPELPKPPFEPWQTLQKLASNAEALLFGQPNFFTPRPVNPMLIPRAEPQVVSFYDATPMLFTLRRFADFALINGSTTRLTLGATNIATGNLEFFDNHRQTIGPEHVLASASMPPGFPATVVGEKLYWDGGCVSDTPLDAIVDEPGHPRMVVFVINLWGAAAPPPQTINGVLWRAKEIRYASGMAREINAVATKVNLRHAVRLLGAAGVPEAAAVPDSPVLRKRRLDIVHIAYRPDADHIPNSDAEFSRSSIAEHQATGHRDMSAALAAQPWQRQEMPAHLGALVHRVERGKVITRPEPKLRSEPPRQRTRKRSSRHSPERDSQSRT
jgi:NTE family protein